MQEMQDMQVWSLGWEDPLEKEMATHSSILAWEISRTEEPIVHGVAKSWTQLSNWAKEHEAGGISDFTACICVWGKFPDSLEASVCSSVK